MIDLSSPNCIKLNVNYQVVHAVFEPKLIMAFIFAIAHKTRAAGNANFSADFKTL